MAGLCALGSCPLLDLFGLVLVAKEIPSRDDNLASASTIQTSASSHLLAVLLAKSHHVVKARFNGWKGRLCLRRKETGK